MKTRKNQRFFVSWKSMISMKIIVLIISLLTLIGLTNYVIAAACAPSDCIPACGTGGICSGTTPDCYCDFDGGTFNPDGACACLNGNTPYFCASIEYDNCYICHDVAQTCDCELGPRSENEYPRCNGDILQEYEAVNTGLRECGNLVTTDCAPGCCLGNPGSSYCVGEGATCSVDGDCCSDSYCDTDDGGYCCKKGWYWDTSSSKCTAGEDECTEQGYNIFSQPTWFFYGYEPYYGATGNYACCDQYAGSTIIRYGQQGNFFLPITVY